MKSIGPNIDPWGPPFSSIWKMLYVFLILAFCFFLFYMGKTEWDSHEKTLKPVFWGLGDRAVHCRRLSITPLKLIWRIYFDLVIISNFRLVLWRHGLSCTIHNRLTRNSKEMNSRIRKKCLNILCRIIANKSFINSE